ncbi:hypothetical protein [Segnochrobactrum spirostomi]|nr:hypothetical protein [Segnochrobactrum spirostomi]
MSTPFDGLIKVPDSVFMRAVRDVEKTDAKTPVATTTNSGNDGQEDPE